MSTQGKPIARPGRLPSSVPRQHSNRQTLRRVSGVLTPAEIFGSDLICDLDSRFGISITIPNNVVGVVDQTGNGNSITAASHATLLAGPLIRVAVGGSLTGAAGPSLPAGLTRSVYTVVANANQNVAAVNDTVARYNSGPPNYTTSDGATYNNTGVYSHDSAIHAIATKYKTGDVSPYYIDGVLIVQAGASAAPAEATTGIAIFGGTFPGTGDFYRHLIVARLSTPAEDVQVQEYFHSIYGNG